MAPLAGEQTQVCRRTTGIDGASRVSPRQRAKYIGNVPADSVQLLLAGWIMLDEALAQAAGPQGLGCGPLDASRIGRDQLGTPTSQVTHHDSAMEIDS